MQKASEYAASSQQAARLQLLDDAFSSECARSVPPPLTPKQTQDAATQEASEYASSSQQAARLQELKGLAEKLQAQLDRVNKQQLALRWVLWGGEGKGFRG
jgi:uncharacterized membrane protein